MLSLKETKQLSKKERKAQEAAELADIFGGMTVQTTADPAKKVEKKE